MAYFSNKGRNSFWRRDHGQGRTRAQGGLIFSLDVESQAGDSGKHSLIGNESLEYQGVFFALLDSWENLGEDLLNRLLGGRSNFQSPWGEGHDYTGRLASAVTLALTGW